MRVGIIQPSFIPWRGYFDFINSVDTFILLDDVQYTRRDWRNRNRIKTPAGSRWLSIPVLDKGQQMSLLNAYVDEFQPWRRKHEGAWHTNYASTPYYKDVLDLLEPINIKNQSLNDMNLRLIRAICGYLDISTPILRASQFSVQGTATARLLSLLQRVDGTCYLSGPSADAYLDKEAFRKAGIGLEYKSYDYDTYPQQWGEFDGAVTILDLIANCGRDVDRYIKSKSSNCIVIPSKKSSSS